MLDLLIELYRSGRLSVRLEVQGQNRIATLEIGSSDRKDAPERRLRNLLDLPDCQTSFELVYARGTGSDGQIAIRTRSLIEVLGQLAGDIDVPEDDVAGGRTYLSLPQDGAAARLPQVAVRHGAFEPRDAYVAVHYDGDWFWIGNDDLRSKRVFSFVMLLLSLSESSRPGQPPVISIPAG